LLNFVHVFQGQNPGPQSMMHGMGQQGPNGKGNAQPLEGRKLLILGLHYSG